ncbi:peptide/nickel transport system permease protein [Okibacterium sp. HSC-33S16]|uniref:ABC transporter permease n=1 Tax=Okibacterium sp. HSC-33S16 TaxID=2910965 RepID=UPI00209C77C2|nr:ABC transporter permease [Okibacterium sp. HSC-33S16]MCP2031165.1 peptide/nickel transport system permease protein [Okibacterium sp. HSC-33S16]
MFGFILRRLLSGVVLLFVISTLAYMLLYVGGGNIARRILGQQATAETVAQKTTELGLDRPLLVQYIDWLSHAVTGDFGTSWFTGEMVSSGITSRLGVTLSIVIGATVITAIVAVIIGVWAAVRGGWVDKVVQGVSILGFAIPGFLIALGLVTLFALNLKWFKPTGYVPLTESATGWLATVTLPIIALAIGGIAGVAQQVRGSVVDALQRDYVRTLRSRGLSFNRVVFKHVLRNAGGPALAVLAVQFVGLLGGAVIVERIFAIPGLGQVAVTATSQGDIPMVMGLVVAIAAMVVIINLLIDLLQGWLNPKVRLA